MKSLFLLKIDCGICLLFGLLLVIAGLVLGVYVGIFVMFIGGIVQLVQSITPTVIASGIAIGIAKVMLASFVGYICGACLVLPGVTLIQNS